MNLTEKPVLTQWPATHYVFVEKTGPFQETAQGCWQQLHANVEAISKQAKIIGFLSLYQIEPVMVYRAGVAVDKKPETLPPGFRYEKFEGGKYSKFVLTGSYENLPEACGRVFEIVEETNLPVKDGMFYIENYVNDPRSTPPEQLVTEILVPTV